MSTSASCDIFHSLHALLHHFKSRMLEQLALQQPDMSFVEMRLLMLAGQQPGVSQKVLVERSHLDKAQITRTLAALEMQGWLERCTDAQDKRIRCLHLTAQGQALFAEMAAWQQALAQTMFGHWPPQVLALLQTSLHGLSAADLPGVAEAAAAHTPAA